MAKFILIIPILFLYSLVSFSQDYSNKFIISASVGGSSSYLGENENEDLDVNNFKYRFHIKTGYFLWKRASVGIYTGYAHQNSKTTVNDTITAGTKRNEFYIGPYYKRYFKLLNRFSFTLFASAYYSYDYLRPQLESQYPVLTNRYNLTFIPGLSYDITDRLSVDMDIGEFTAYIMSIRRKDPALDEDSQKTVSLATSTSLNKFRITTFVLGFSYRIGK